MKLHHLVFAYLYLFFSATASAANSDHVKAFGFLHDNLENEPFHGGVKGDSDNIEAVYFSVDDGHELYGHGICVRMRNKNNDVLGLALIRIQPSQIRIAQLKSTNRRGRGVGTGLIAIAVLAAKHLGFEKIDLTSSTSAVTFYEKLGFCHGVASPSCEHPMKLTLDNPVFLERARKLGYFAQ